MSRIEWLLGSLLVLLLAVVGLAALLFWFRPQLPDASAQATASGFSAGPAGLEPTSVFEGRTAQIAYALALRSALSWQGDARLVNATATWPQGAGLEDMRSGVADWGYTFYSPSSGRVAAFSVTGDQATQLTEGPANTVLDPGDAGAWQLDSPAVVATLLDLGGRAFFDRAGVATLILSLSTTVGGGRVEWFASLVSSQTGDSITVRQDATTGEVLSVEQLP